MSTEPIIVSYSELDAYRQCPLKHHLGYVLRWTKPPTSSDDPRSRGQQWHLILEVFYRTVQAAQQRDPSTWYFDQSPQAAAYAVLDDPTKVHPDNRDLLEWMLTGYLQRWLERDRRWRVIGVEQALQVPLLNRAGRPTRFTIKAKIDLLVQDLDLGGLWIVDHKSGSELPTEQALEIDDQFGLYQWILGQATPGADIRGTIHNAARTRRLLGDQPNPAGQNRHKPQTLDQRYRRTYLARDPKELTNLALDAYNVAQHAYPPPSRPLPLYSSPDPRICSWKCDFKEPHLVLRAGGSIERVMPEWGFVQDFTRH